MNDLEDKLESRGAEYIVLNARENAIDFYKKHGYDIVEEAHTLFDSIPHYRMRKDI